MMRNYQKNLGKSKRNKTKIAWKTIRICRSYNLNNKCCFLCLDEIYEIATYNRGNLLNKRTEIQNFADSDVITDLPIVKP